MARENLLLSPQDRADIIWTNCLGREHTAQIAWRAFDHISSENNRRHKDFVNRNYKNKPAGSVWAEGYALRTLVSDEFEPDVNVLGWDDLALLDESNIVFHRAVTARRLAMDEGLPKTEFYRNYRKWHNLCIERNAKNLIPAIEFSLYNHPTIPITVMAGSGHLFLDPSVQPFIPEHLTLNIHSDVESTLGNIVQNVPVVVFSASLPTYYTDLKTMPNS